jgi:hypothetical protein
MAADVRHIEGDEPPGLDLARGPKRVLAQVAQGDQVEATVEDVDGPGAGVGGVEHRMSLVDCQSGIDGARRRHFDERG